MCVSGSVTARLIGSWVDHEGRRSGLEVEGPASKGMYSVRLNKHTGSENDQYLVRWGQLCAVWQRGQTARGNTFTATPTAGFYFSQCNISLANADALKYPRGSKNPSRQPWLCVCARQMILLIFPCGLAMWRGPKIVFPLNTWKRGGKKSIDCENQKAICDFTWHAGQFIFLPRLLLRHTPRHTHTNIREKWLRENRFLFYSFI